MWSFGSVYCCNAVVERILHRQLLIGSTLVSLLQKCVNLLVLLTVQMDQIFWICDAPPQKKTSGAATGDVALFTLFTGAENHDHFDVKKRMSEPKNLNKLTHVISEESTNGGRAAAPGTGFLV